ncbi:MAG TPA: glycosyltransferase [Pyrinomonadaceae bacterium]|nr:glycosyltransferase [Pyrinomonadaceae bacterium]
MSYRFQKFTTIYPAFLRQFLADNPAYERLSYRELYDKLVSTRYGWADFFANHLQNLGNEAQDLFASVEPLQKAWAKENGVSYGESSWLKDIVLAQVRAFKPDVLFLQDLYLFDQGFRQQLRETCGEKVLILGWRAAPTPDFSAFKDLDVILTCVPNFVQNLRRNGANAALMPMAFEDSTLGAVGPAAERDLDFTFAGSLGAHDGHHAERHALIEKLLRSTPLQVWSEIGGGRPQPRADSFLERVGHKANEVLSRAGTPERLRARLPLVRRGGARAADPASQSINQRHPGRFHQPVFGFEYFKILARSKIAFNSHIDCSEDFAGNMRLYEATGMGACLITDWKKNLPDIFDPDVEVVTYRGAEECVEKVLYLLDHEEERRAVAAAGQRRTLRDHTLAKRAAQLDEIIRSTHASRATVTTLHPTHV